MERRFRYYPLLVLAALLQARAATEASHAAAGEGAASSAANRQRALSVAGVQKVIQMLTDMQAKTKQEKNDEEVAFAKFSTWCSEEIASTKSDIAGNTEEISLLSTEIEKLKGDVVELASSIGGIQEKVAGFESDREAETKEREKEHTAYLAESSDYKETIDAVSRALEVLEKEDYDRPGSAAGSAAVLLQLRKEKKLPEKVQSIVTAYLQMMDSDDADDASQDGLRVPEANSYEFQSGSLISMLKHLLDQFRGKLATCEKEEMNSKHAYDMVVLDLTDSIENSNKDIEAKSAEKSRKTEKAAEDEKELGATTDIKAADEKALTDLTAECSEKEKSFKEKQQLRTEEIEAIGQAIDILSSPEVAGNAEKYLELSEAAAKVGRTTTFVQVARKSSRTGSIERSVRRRARDLLEAAGGKLHSNRLSLVAEHLMSGDPFAKVKELIDDLITRLEEEAHEDATHEGYCDTEMGKSKITRTKLSEEIDGLTAAVEDGKATIVAMAESITKLGEEVAALETAVAEATALRQEETAKNAVTVKDAQAAQKAVEAATAVLHDFYEKAMTATALVQGAAHARQRAALMAKGYGLKETIKMGSQEWTALANPSFDGTVDTGHKEGMQTFGEDYQGQQDENDFGVMAMLEVIQSDFANLEADTTAAETASQKAYDEFLTESKKNKALRNKKIEMTEMDKASTEAKLREDIADLKATQDQLLAAERYYENLVPQCVDKGMTFEERTKAREQEIESLKQALVILNSEDIDTSAL
jgi:hypothetical protein